MKYSMFSLFYIFHPQTPCRLRKCGTEKIRITAYDLINEYKKKNQKKLEEKVLN